MPAPPAPLRSTGIIAALIALGVFGLALFHAMDARARIRAARKRARDIEARFAELKPWHEEWQRHRHTLERLRELQPPDGRPAPPFDSPRIPDSAEAGTNRIRIDDEWTLVQINASWADMPFERIPAILEPLPQASPPWRIVGFRLEAETGPSRGRFELEIETLLSDRAP